MEKLGFSKNYIEFIKILYTENKSIISNNGFLSETISLFRGLRQVCPLSLPIYVIQGEVTTENINKNDTIKGIKIPNLKKPIKILQYAGDSNFFLKDQESIKNILKYFEKLKKLQGQQLILKKQLCYQ